MNMKWLYRLIPILLITLVIPAAPIQAMSTWADTDYPYRFEVTVESDYVEVDEEFPFVIDDAPAHFWDNVQEDGADILVCAEDKTKLYSELATWSYLFHDIELWVKGELSSTVDTVFYVYYGIDIEWADNDYTGITGSVPAQNVWDENFVFVSHMNDNPLDSTQILDSTRYGNHGTKGAGTAAPVEVDGLVGKAQDFSGSGKCYINLGGDQTQYNLLTATVEVLIQPNGANPYDNFAVVVGQKGNGAGHSSGAWHILQSRDSFNFNYYIYDDHIPDGELSQYQVQTRTLVDETWNYMANVIQGVGLKHGVALNDSYAEYTQTHEPAVRDGEQTRLGTPIYYNNFLNAETRISSTARGAGWISTTNNSMQESGFTVTGESEVYPCVATNFTYSNLISQQNYASIDLSWDYCADEIEYTVVRSETWYPLDPLDGEVRYSGSLLGFTDTFTPGENTYYYSIFSTTDMGTNSSYSTLLVNMPMTPVEVGGNMMFVIIPIVIALGIAIFALRSNIHMGQGKIKPDVVMRGIAIGLVALVAILAMLGVL
jgi:hypothetical protein